jgi:hypothetical protein
MALKKNKIQEQSTEEYSYKKMLDYGWTPEQASGIVGNLKYESGLNTSKEGDVGYKGGSSFGVAQFRGDRLKTLQNRYGSKWTDLDNQLEFVNWELNNTHKSAGDKLRQARGVYNTGQIVSDYYEIPAKKWNQNDDRQKAVYNLHRKYSGVQLTDEDRANFLNGTAQRAMDNYNATLQTPTIALPQISNLVSPIDSLNLAENTPKEDNSVEIARMQLQQKQNEENLFNDLLKASQVQYVDPNEVTDYTQQENPQDLYQNGGEIVKDDNGYWNPDNWGKSVEIASNHITMKGVNEPLYVVPDVGEPKVLFPNQEYIFPKATKVVEHPIKNNRFK